MLENKLNFAAIDIGSNALRLLIKGINPGESARDLTKSLLVRVPLRLGEDSFSSGVISSEKEKQLLRTIRSFKLLMKVFGVVKYRACATSAMRDASNGEKLARQIWDKLDINLEVIGGEEEARIVYDSHIGDLLDMQRDYLYVDVGGGSTEVSLISHGELRYSHSYNIGTVRMLSGKVKPQSWELLGEELEQLACQHPTVQIIGSGGNINKLQRMSEEKTRSYLEISELKSMHAALKPLSLAERMSRYRLNPDRADVIVPAAEIFLYIAEKIHAESIFVPTIGISDGITHTLCENYLRDQTK